MIHLLLFAFSFLALTLGNTPTSAEIRQSENTEVIAKGTFEGRSNHKASGNVRILRTGSAAILLELGDDFRFDGAPDPQLGFGSDGYDRSTLFSRLDKNRGKQVYELPDSLDVARYNEVWIWCKRFNVPLAVASLEQ